MKTIIVVGGGAAGLMAAISASGENGKVTVIDHNDKAGRKLFITGKGRCNITNACPPEEFLRHVVTNPRFLYSAFSRFSNLDMMDFLEREGLTLKTERGQRVFPQSDHSSDVIRTLTKACRTRGVSFRFGCHVQDLLFEDLLTEPSETCGGIPNGRTGDCKVEARKKDHGKETGLREGKGKKGPERRIAGVRLSDGTELACDAVILACGGRSYPSTGSDGSGFDLARTAGHRVTDLQPSLVPFETAEPWCRDLMGLSLKNVSIRVKCGKKLVYEGF